MIRSVVTLFTLKLIHAAEPNPPNWPSSVQIFGPSDTKSTITSAVNTAYQYNGGDPRTTCNNGQFSSQRYAFMFLPGTYNDLDVPIGYYTSVYGLGASPTYTKFDGGKGPFSEEGCADFTDGALCTFWRSAENFWTTTNSTMSNTGSGMVWSVSQAAPLRNVKVDNDLIFFEYMPQSCCAAGYASGGWGSGLQVGGKTSFGSQQQFIVRSSDLAANDNSDTAAWNGVFVATKGAPAHTCAGAPSVVNMPNVPAVAEKPYITSSDGKLFNLIKPPVQFNTDWGVPWTSTGIPNSELIPFEDVYVTQPGDTAKIINAKLNQGLHIIISPGIYNLEASIIIDKADTVVLGLGFATLVAPGNGDPCIRIGDVDGVRLSGVLLQAGQWETTGTMLQVGSSGSYEGNSRNPIVLTDIFVRVGGPYTNVGPVKESMVTIKAGATIIDNTWLWRADHTEEGAVLNSTNPVPHGLVVEADNVKAYGLAVEHTLEDNVLWKGKNGLTYFFQAEIMYDYLEPVWNNSCYTLGHDASGHVVRGAGCYSFFRDAPTHVRSGFNTGGNTDVDMDNMFSVYLSGAPGSQITSIVDDDQQHVTDPGQVKFHCYYKNP
jgi:hypothetical protein